MLRTLPHSPDPQVPGPVPWVSCSASLHVFAFCNWGKDETLLPPGHLEEVKQWFGKVSRKPQSQGKLQVSDIVALRFVVGPGFPAS